MTINLLAIVALALGSVAMGPTAAAQRYPDARLGQGGNQGLRGDNARGSDPRRSDGRGDRRCTSGATGTLLGALAGGLLGRSIDRGGDRAAGAGGGALAGRAVERSNNPGYCR